MSEVQWQVGLTLQADPQAVRDYRFDFSEWLDDDTIANATVVATNCTAAVRNQDDSNVTIRVSEVTKGAGVTLEITTAGGQFDNFTTFFTPFDK